MLLGNVLDVGVPSDDTVGAAQIKDDLISGTTALASEPADTDEFLVSDAGTLKRIDYSLIKAANTPAFEAHLSSSTSQLSNDTDTKVTFDTEIYDSDSTFSSGRFTPAVEGKYMVYGRLEFDDTNVSTTEEHMVKIYKNGAQASVFFNMPNTTDSQITFAEVFALDDDDYIEIYAKINNSNGGRLIRGLGSTQKASAFGAFRIIGA